MIHLHYRWMVDRTLRSESVWPWSPPALRAHLARCEACRGYYDEGALVLRAVRPSPGAPGLGELSG